jgi:Leucine-rich repeat (LRR) protein
VADPTLKQLVATLRSRPWVRRFLPPVDETALAELEARLGSRLPPVIRSFYSELCGGEEDRGYLGILTLERALPNAARLTLPIGPDREARVLFPVRERDDGPFEAVVCEGPLSDTIWLLDGSRVSAMLGVDGQPRHALDWLRATLEESARGMPAPIDGAAAQVNLAGLDLDAAPAELADATSATSVSLAGNRLTDLPEALRRMPALEQLAISDNQLTHLPAWLGDLALRSLNVSRNRLHALPPSLRRLDKLVELIADGNHLEVLSTDGWSALQTLSVAKNRIERIDGPGPLALRTIDVGDNRLRELPNWIGELPDLFELKLAGNPLRALPASLEGASFSLVEIGALPSRSDSGAQPTWDWSAVFELLGSCEIDWLRIAGSPLAALPESARALRRVRRLAIQSAALTSLPEFVAELEELEELWLDDNQLTSLPSAFAAHPRLRNIVLFANPIERNELDRLRASMPHVTIDG